MPETKKRTEQGFTLIELLVVIAIIGLLASVVLLALNSARAKARDAKRLADVRQMSSAFEQYFNDNSSYPSASSGLPVGLVPNYIGVLPEAPLPADGPCAATPQSNTYTYQQLSGGTQYSYSFCIGNVTGGLSAGYHVLNSGGIQ